MIKNQQVRLLMKELRRNKPLATAAAKAGMSERTARKWRDSGKLPSDPSPARHWRTREDPLEALWPEAEALLRADPGLQAKVVFEELQRRHPGQLQSGQLRTLQRRFRAWRVRQGPDREVYFEQEREPGAQCQSDFTDMGALGVTIRGERYKHLVYRFVLPYSNWESVAIASSETFEALVGGLQESLWELGGVPREHRTDNLSAATHELRQSGGRAFNRAYEEFLAHYGLAASRNYPGNAHENGDVEAAHGHFKTAVDQRLRLSGTRDFSSVERYARLLDEIAGQRNSRRGERLAAEQAALRPLPPRRLPVYREERRTVTRGSVVRVASKAYSVPSRLIGEQLTARLYTDRVELHYGGKLVARHDRALGKQPGRVDYRHVAHALLRKPGAFAQYRYREEMFPSEAFRRAYDKLCEGRSQGHADLEYVRILHLAATTLETRVEAALQGCLEAGERPSFERVRAAAAPPRPEAPEVRIAEPDLDVYDELLADTRGLS